MDGRDEPNPWLAKGTWNHCNVQSLSEEILLICGTAIAGSGRRGVALSRTKDDCHLDQVPLGSGVK
jgi:hypothetical protein